MNRKTWTERWVHWTLVQKKFVFIALALLIFVGVMTAPFQWNLGFPRYPVAIDAIPDVGENQQIILTDWTGRSPQDIEDQITYPMTLEFMGMPGVMNIRAFSYFGFSLIYVIFEEDVEFYHSRSLIVEKLSSLPANTLPKDASPRLGPDATSLGQVFWYTLEGQDSLGNTVGGWDLGELRSLQDFQVKYALQSVSGVAEVSSAGGMEKEYQIDVDPDKLRHYEISLEQVYQAVAESNQEVGAQTIEINRVEYILRAKGYVETIQDLENTAVLGRDGQVVLLKEIARIQIGPSTRRGLLDKGGTEVAGGVVVARYGVNPTEVLEGIENKIAEISKSLPRKTLSNGTVSQVTIVPFYNRSKLISETLTTLKDALVEELLITFLVVLFLLIQLRSSLIICIILPINILICFGAMKLFGIEANVVALSGIAIAIGTMVDVGIVLTESIEVHLSKYQEGDSKLELIKAGTLEVMGSIMTSVFTTIISFIPVFALNAAEGKLFSPLAYTKTFALFITLLISLSVIPPLTLWFSKRKLTLVNKEWLHKGLLALATILLSHYWMPLGMKLGFLINLLFVIVIIFTALYLVRKFIELYPILLLILLKHKAIFLSFPMIVVSLGFWVWSQTPKEFMPTLDEGTFLYMPSTMPHASLEEAHEQLSQIDELIETIPEVKMAVGKLGRVESPLDPAPISMFEIIIHYYPEYSEDSKGNTVRHWRDHIKSSDDIWDEIVQVAQIPGVTSAPKLMPIAARQLMQQSGIRASMGLKIQGPDIQTLNDFSPLLEKALKTVPGISPHSIVGDELLGKPYLELEIDRIKASQYGLSIEKVQNTFAIALGGKVASYQLEGREKYPIRVRYPREERDALNMLPNILVTTPQGRSIPLSEISQLRYRSGPPVIKSENGFLSYYVIFEPQSGVSESELLSSIEEHLDQLISGKELLIPNGVRYEFIGDYKNQLRSQRTLMLVIPLSLFFILLILYIQFNRFQTVLIVYTGVIVSWAGGFCLIGLYNTSWFMNFDLLGINIRELFHIGPIHMSLAVWVGFIALSGIATDDGVLMSHYIQQKLKTSKLNTREDLYQLVVEAASQRIRPAMMTTATTLLALIPIVMSLGKGSDIMRPMSVPILGGMFIAIFSVFMVPIFTVLIEQRNLKPLK